MGERDFRRALKDAEAARPAELDPVAEVRLRRRIEAGIEELPRRRVRAWSFGIASLAVVAAAVFVVVQPPPEIGGFRVQGGLEVALAADGVHAPKGASLVTADRANVAVVADAVVRREESDVRVVGGIVRVDVDKRRSGESPFVVRVSGGRIAVLGTSFTVEQLDDGGAVTLHEGSIRFTYDDGVQVMLAPGDRVAWPRPAPPPAPEPVPEPVPVPAEPAPAVDAVPAPTVVPAAPVVPIPTATEPAPPTPAPAAPVPTDLPVAPVVKETDLAPTVVTPEEKLRADAVLKRVSGLRSRGRFDDAVGAIDTALSERYAAETRERLSMERLSLLAFQVHDRDRTCAALARHLDEFGDGRYAESLQQVRREAGCKEQP